MLQCSCSLLTYAWSMNQSTKWYTFISRKFLSMAIHYKCYSAVTVLLQASNTGWKILTGQPVRCVSTQQYFLSATHTFVAHMHNIIIHNTLLDALVINGPRNLPVPLRNEMGTILLCVYTTFTVSLYWEIIRCPWRKMLGNIHVIFLLQNAWLHASL